MLVKVEQAALECQHTAHEPQQGVVRQALKPYLVQAIQSFLQECQLVRAVLVRGVVQAVALCWQGDWQRMFGHGELTQRALVAQQLRKSRQLLRDFGRRDLNAVVLKLVVARRGFDVPVQVRLCRLEVRLLERICPGEIEVWLAGGDTLRPDERGALLLGWPLAQQAEYLFRQSAPRGVTVHADFPSTASPTPRAAHPGEE